MILSLRRCVRVLLLAALLGRQTELIAASPTGPAPIPPSLPDTTPPSDAGTPPALRAGKFTISEADRHWWAFQPLHRPALPTAKAGPPMLNPIDVLLLARLSTNGLEFSPPAPRRELLRRAYADLLGLPPTPEAVKEFEQDVTPGAWERRIDQLLASPRYGERWARHWLDLVRYADSNGYERDGEKPFAWRYRDYVIRSLNADKAYDQFILEQIAGDELPGFNPDAIIATGFYRLHVWDDEPDSTLAAEFDDLDDIMVSLSTMFLGLTIGCARCHDHKFDPISQADYYQMLSFFRSLHPYGLPHTGGGGRGTGRITRYLASPEAIASWEAGRSEKLQKFRSQVGAAPPEEKKRLETALREIESQPAPFPQALAITEQAIQPTHVFHRGDVQSPGQEVQPAFLSVLGGQTANVSATPGTSSSGRRLALARWIARPDHPLTARVLVNRLWQHHFGRGLVRTPNDFGRTGERPTNPDLLDYLGSEFMAGGWHLKPLHKLIMMSQAYQMSSRAQNPSALRLDEGNEWFWRQNPRRLEAETVRDTLLTLGEGLSLKMGGPGVFVSLPAEVHSTQDAAGKGWRDDPLPEQQRRTIYLYVKRALLLPLLDAFDYTTTTVPVGVRSSTTVAPQALMLLNDRFVQQQAAQFYARLAREAGPREEDRIRRAFELALQRLPSNAELQSARRLLAHQRSLAEANLPPASEQSTADKGSPSPDPWQIFCLAMLNLNELVYID